MQRWPVIADSSTARDIERKIKSIEDFIDSYEQTRLAWVAMERECSILFEMQSHAEYFTLKNFFSQRYSVFSMAETGYFRHVSKSLEKELIVVYKELASYQRRLDIHVSRDEPTTTQTNEME